MKTKILFLIFFLMCAGSAVAQTDEDYSRFMNAAGNQSMLFRGRQAVQYVNVRYNGHYYWDTPQFKEGTVMLAGKRYDDVLLNIDACAKNLLACSVQGAPAIALNRDDVEWFDIEGSHFVNLQLEGRCQNADIGFYAVLKDGPEPVYMRVDKLLRSGTDDYNGKDGIGYDDPNYKREILTSFICLRKYYTVKNGALKKINEKKAKALING